MIDVPRVLGRLGIEARRVGKEWLARCPNPGHEDRHPSWGIRDEPGSDRHSLHNCLSCGYAGAVVDLVMLVVGLDYAAAREWLAGDDVGVAPPSGVELIVRQPRRIFRLPVGVDVRPLAEWVPSARAYAEGRGVTAAQVDRWGLGYAAAGVLEGRVVFVKRTRGGEVAGYSARTFVGAPRRYLEPSGREGAVMSVLFGEQHWPEHAGGVVVVVEGAINALAVERAWPGVSVATTSGSMLHPSVPWKLMRFGEVVVLTDPDAAGDKLGGQLEASLARHVRLRRVRLPEGEDAASLGLDALRAALTAE